MVIFDFESTLSQLTLDEKIQLTAGVDFWRTFSIHRNSLSFPIPYAKLTDGPNGARGGGDFNYSVPAALFPSPSCLGATWDVDLSKEMGKGIAKDSRSKKCHVSLAPTINIQRDPRAGRYFESYSEDPVLSGLIGSGWVRGCQDVGVGATPKHFVGNECETDRMNSSSNIPEQALREVYLEPFKRIFKQMARDHKGNGKEDEKAKVFKGQPACIMTAYNRLNQWSSSENEDLQVEILRREWGFKGMVMSDWFALHDHGLKATDLEMPGPSVRRSLDYVKSLLEVGKLNEQQDIEERARAVLRMLNVISPLGFSMSPEEEEEKSVDDEEINKSIRQIAAEGAVLIKNEDNILPLSLSDTQNRTEKNIALIGKPWTEAIQSGGGSANLTPQRVTAAMDAFQAALRESKCDNVQLRHHFGCEIHKFPPDPIPSDGKVKLIFLDREGKEVGRSVTETPRLERNATLPPEVEDQFFDSVKATFQLKPSEKAKYRLGLVSFGDLNVKVKDAGSGKLEEEINYQGERSFFDFVLNPTKQLKPFTLDFQSYNSQEVIIEVDYKVAPFNMGNKENENKEARAFGFRIGIEKELNEDEEIRQAVQVADECDLTIILTATGKEWESEGFDRPDIRLPRKQDDLVRAIAKGGAEKNKIIVINVTGSVVEMPWKDEVGAIVQAWFGGQEAGNAIVDILLGKGQAPASGRFANTWPHSIEQHPSGTRPEHFPGTHREGDDQGPQVDYIEARLVGYKWYERKKIEPSMYFGGGIGGYTTFNTTLERVSGAFSGPEDLVKVEVRVRNTGERSGKEVVQIYVAPPKEFLNEEQDVPMKRLAACQVVRLEAKEEKVVTLIVEQEDVSSWKSLGEKGYKGAWQVRPGQYTVILAKSADPKDEVASEAIQVTKAWQWNGIGRL